MHFERVRGGRTGRSWLNTGEEEKMTKKEEGALERRRNAALAVEDVQQRWF